MKPNNFENNQDNQFKRNPYNPNNLENIQDNQFKHNSCNPTNKFNNNSSKQFWTNNKIFSKIIIPIP
eukprot:UN22191